MAKKKIRKIRAKDIKQGPIRHKEGLSPVLEELARVLYARVGHFLYPSFEQWELGFMRDMHPWRELLIWENIARTFDLYMAEHPDAANGQEIVGTLASISMGQIPKTDNGQELNTLFQEAGKRRWMPYLQEPFEFSIDEAVLLDFRDIIDETDGMIYPNIRGKIDCRRILADAEIIGGQSTTTDEFFIIYGQDSLDDDGKIPFGTKTVVVRLDADNEETAELDKMCVVVEEIKGRHDCQ